MGSPPARIPVTVLTGVEEAGEPTLLNRILHADHGCICCTLRGDLLNSALQLLGRREPPEYLIIEASGVSDPWAVAETFALPELRPYFTLDGVITVVDAEYVRYNKHYEELIVDQVSAADIVVLSKIDLVDENRRADVEACIRRIVPRARILPAVQGELPFQLLLGVGRYRLELTPARSDQSHARHAQHDHVHGLDCDHSHEHEHDHGAAFSSWSYTGAQPFSLKALRQAVLELPEAIFRARGLIFLAEVPQRRAVLQAVGPRVNVSLAEPWGDAPPATQLVFLSTPGGLDETALRVALDGCLVDLPVATDVAPQQTWMREVSA